jgi:hypothetical protein
MHASSTCGYRVLVPSILNSTGAIPFEFALLPTLPICQFKAAVAKVAAASRKQVKLNL